MLGSIYSGFSFSAARTGQATTPGVAQSCATGNCTFPPFQSLAVCSGCKDITSLLTITCFNTTTDDPVEKVLTVCQNSLPNGLNLNVIPPPRDASFVAGSGYLSPVTMPPYGYTVLNFSILRRPVADFETGADQNVSAFECFLYWCVNSYRSKIENGQLEENIFDSWHSISMNGRWNDKYSAATLIPPALNKSEPNSRFYVSPRSTYSLSVWLADRFSFSNSYLDDSSNSSAISSSIGDMQQLFLGRDPTYIFSSLARSITSHMRSISPEDQVPVVLNVSSNGPDMLDWTPVSLANGTAHYLEVYIAVRWAWLAFPAALILLTAIFLSLTIASSARSDTPAWKCSPLPLLFHGLDQQAEKKDSATALREVYQMEQLASEMQVQLKDEDRYLRLERSDTPGKALA
ncbi:MAG: hypothetical protein Q9227_008293 [Pyrenula ochraceoflavens]